VILFLKVLFGWVTTKSKVCNIPGELEQHAMNCLGQFWIAFTNGSTKQPSVHSQTLASLSRLWGKEKHDAVTCSANTAFSSTTLRSSAPLKSVSPTTQQTIFTYKRLWQILLDWISYKKPC